MLNWATKPAPNRTPERLIAANPLKGYQPHAFPDATRIPHAPARYAAPSEVATFLRFVYRRACRWDRASVRGRHERLLALLVRCLAGTGARPQEVCGLRWDEVAWDAGTTAAGHPYAKAILPPTAGRTAARRASRGRSSCRPGWRGP